MASAGHCGIGVNLAGGRRGIPGHILSATQLRAAVYRLNRRGGNRVVRISE